MSDSTASLYEELINQAAQHIRSGEHDKAVEILERTSKSISRLRYETLRKHPKILALFIVACMEGLELAGTHGLLESARSFRDCVQRVMPASERITQLLLIFASVYLGELDKAREEIAGLVDASDLTFDQRLKLAQFAMKAFAPELALQVLEHTEVPAPPQKDDPAREEKEWDIRDYWQTYAQALLQAGRLEELDTLLPRRGEIGARSLPYPFIVQALLKRQDYARAMEYADRAPDLANRGLLRGMVAAAQGKMDWARDEWWRVVREPLDIKGERLNFSAWMECALLLDDQEKMAAALEAGTPALEDMDWFRLYRSLYQAKHGEPAEALPAFREALRGMFEMMNVPVSKEWMIWHVTGLVERVLPEEVRDEFLAAIQEVVGSWLAYAAQQGR
ncbi:MAG: tetratricopeptide repeat protein [Anaerolineae bacterium]